MSFTDHHNAAKTTTWLTPQEFIERLGPFDLDPCAAPSPRPWPTARAHIELPTNGLAAPWSGRIWLNPPYGAEIENWMARLAAHGRGTALVFSRTDTEWFHRYVWPVASAALFPKGRITFRLPDGGKAKFNGGAPSVFVAYGDYDAEKLRRSGIAGSYVALREAPGVFA